MNFLGFTITRHQKSKIENQKSLSPATLAWLRGNDYTDPSALASTVLTNAYEQVPWVYRAINVLAEQVANIPFLLSEGVRGREHLITSGPLLDFYARPHPLINRFQYWELRVLWLLLRGESIRIPMYRNPDGSLSHSPLHSLGPPNSAFSTPHSSLDTVLILDPGDFQHVVENHQLIGWRYTGLPTKTPLESQVFLPEEVWFEKLPNPFDFWRGLSPLAVADLATRTDFAAAAFMRGFLENNADNGLIVRTNEQLDDDQREQVLAALRGRKRHAGTADRPLLLWSSAEVVQPKLSSADLQFLENRKFSRAEICAAFGVPEEILTTTDHNKYDVMQGARLNFIENRVAPLCARLEAEEHNTTIRAILGLRSSPRPSPLPSAVGWFDLDSLPIMQAARRARLATAKTGFDMGIPLNELNRVLDLGFKPLPWGDKGYVPTALSEVGDLNPQSPGHSSTKPPIRISIPATLAPSTLNPQPSTAALPTANLQPATCDPAPAADEIKIQNSKFKNPDNPSQPPDLLQSLQKIADLLQRI